MKNCSSCKISKELSEFNARSKAKDGKQNYCRECSKIKFKQHVPKTQQPLNYNEKYCNTCCIVRHIEDFSGNCDGKDGLHSKCKICLSEYARTRREDPAYKLLLKEIARNYTKLNSISANIKSAKRRANRLSRTPSWVDKEYEDLFLAEMYDLAQRRFKLQGIKYHVDHIVPFVSEYVCGLHCSDNLQLLTAAENLAKSNYYWPDMW